MGTDSQVTEAMTQKVAQLEEQLAWMKFQRDALTQVVPGKFSYLDPNLRYQYVSQEYEEWYQKPKEEIIGKTVEDLMGKGAAQQLQEHLETVLTGQAVHYEFTKLFADGEERTMAIDYIPHFSDAGEFLGFFASCQDVTELKQLHEALRKSQLQQRSETNTAPVSVS